MTRRLGFNICGCPQCGKDHPFSVYGSVNFNVYVPPDFLKPQVTCECGTVFDQSTGIFRKRVRRLEDPDPPGPWFLPKFFRRWIYRN